MAKLTTDDEEYTGCSTDCSQISFEQQQADSIHVRLIFFMILFTAVITFNKNSIYFV